MPFRFVDQFDGNPEHLRPSFWYDKEVCHYTDSMDLWGKVFYNYRIVSYMYNAQPVLHDDEDGYTFLVVDADLHKRRLERAPLWNFAIFTFMLIPARWTWNILNAMKDDILGAHSEQ